MLKWKCARLEEKCVRGWLKLSRCLLGFSKSNKTCVDECLKWQGWKQALQMWKSKVKDCTTYQISNLRKAQDSKKNVQESKQKCKKL